MVKSSISTSTKDNDKQNDSCDLKKVFTAFAGLPRVVRLVWSASPGLAAGMATFTIIGGFTPLANAIIARLLLDSVIQAFIQHTFALIWLPVILQLLVNLLDRVSNTFTALLQTLLQERVSEHVQLLILRKANTLDLAFFENPEFHDKLRNATQDANNKPFMMISQTFNLIRAIVTLLSMLGLLLHLAWWLVLVAVVIPFPAFIANSRYSLKGYWKMRWQSPEKRQQMYINQVMTLDDYNKEIKLFNLGDFFIQRYHELAEKFYRENKSLEVPRNVTSLLWSTLSVVANSSVYLYVALQAVLHRISIGSLSQYTIAVNQVGLSVQGVLDGIGNLYENNLFVDTIFDFLAYESKIVSPKNPATIEAPLETKGLDIEFRNVSFTYEGKEQLALHNISFTLHSGETIALVGRNGAGKTTLVKLLTRLYDPDEGEILIGGRNIKEYDLQDLREQIGVIFQDFVKYAMKAQENIGMGRIADRIFVIENGCILESGSHSELIHLDGRYAELFNLQAEAYR